MNPDIAKEVEEFLFTLIHREHPMAKGDEAMVVLRSRLDLMEKAIKRIRDLITNPSPHEGKDMPAEDLRVWR